MEKLADTPAEMLYYNENMKEMSSQKETPLFSVVRDDLRQGGRLSLRLPGYEERRSQIEMARLVAQALSQEQHATIEAPTGVGKSYAYLVPTIRAEKIAVVSTSNKALQEQLFYKDIPFLQKHLCEFDAALVKGVNNYLCLDRLDEEQQQLQFYLNDRQYEQLTHEMHERGEAFDGDFETLSFALKPALRGRINGDSDRCAWQKCPFYIPCYIRQMRERARSAQIIVVNHTLLLLDALTSGSILPEHDVVIIDEAHALEEEATKVFTLSIHASQVESLLSLKRFRAHLSDKRQQEIIRLFDETWDQLRQCFQDRTTDRITLQDPIEPGLQLAHLLEQCGHELLHANPAFETEKEEVLYKKLVKRTQHLAEQMKTVFSVADQQKYVYYLERSQRGQEEFAVEAKAAPLDVSADLRRCLFDEWTTICTSATLTTVGFSPSQGPTFEYFRRRVGLSDQEVIEGILPPLFNYQQQALLYVPPLAHMPEPAYGTSKEAQAYTRQIALQMYDLVCASRGRAFLLFSSRRMLEATYDYLAPHLTFPLLKQGELPRQELIRRFRSEEGSILFGLKSFWEGVDIPGEALSLVVIDKLPFDPPDDPVHEARVALMKAAGENWFGIYVLPQAVLRLKQGMGRLIRSKDDWGVMALLDSRMFSKSYGKRIFSALPSAKRSSTIKDVQHFFL